MEMAPDGGSKGVMKMQESRNAKRNSKRRRERDDDDEDDDDDDDDDDEEEEKVKDGGEGLKQSIMMPRKRLY